MQIMRFVVFFIQENLYSNILSNSIFIRYHRIKMLDFIRCQQIKTFASNLLLKNSEYLILQVLGYSECLILHVLVYLECLILQVLGYSECLILLKVSVLQGSTI